MWPSKIRITPQWGAHGLKGLGTPGYSPGLLLITWYRGLVLADHVLLTALGWLELDYALH